VLWELCSGPLPPIEALQSRQALAKQFAHILDFTLRFDEMKMCTPAVQNDFSYYRRTMNRDLHWMHHTEPDNVNEQDRFADGAHDPQNVDCFVPIDLANTISFFYADSTPMLGALRKAIETFVTTVS
jgi:hypothetical protein